MDSSASPPGDSRLPVPIGSRALAAPAARPSGAVRTPAVRHAAITPQFVLRALSRWWVIVTPVALLFAVAATGFLWFTFRPQYRAAAWLQIQEVPTHLAYPSQDNPRRFVQNQIELLRSSLVLSPVVANPEIAALPDIQKQEDPVAYMARQLRVAGLGDSEIFEVAYLSANGSSAAKIVNAVVDSYLRLRNEHDANRNQRMLELLDEEKHLRETEVTRLRENVKTLSEQILGKDPFSGIAKTEILMANRPLDQLVAQLTSAEVNRTVLEFEIEAFDKATNVSNSEVPAKLLDATLDRHPEVQQTKALLAQKQSMLARISQASVHGESDPAYRRLAADIKRLEQTLDRTKAALRPEIKEDLKAAAELSQGEALANLQVGLARARATEDSLREQYQKQLKEAGQTGGQSLELEFARAELLREEKVFEIIAQRALALRTEMRAPERVTPMKRAEVPLLATEAFPWKKWLVAMVVCVGAPFALVVLIEHLVRRIGDAQQLDEEAAIPVVGEVSRLPMKSRGARSAVATQHDLSLFEESVDSLRTCLVLGQHHQDLQVIAVGSAVAGEGKTSVAAQLAVSLARASGAKTLLIDADLRSPDVHRIFQIESSPGLAELLEDRTTLEQAVNTSWSELVHVLPAGEISLNPHTVINNGGLKRLLAEARSHYAYIVIDTPPILLASESLSVAVVADGTLLCAMRDHSREGQVRSAAERLRAVGARVLGSVLSGIPARQYAAKYGNYPYSRTYAN